MNSHQCSTEPTGFPWVCSFDRLLRISAEVFIITVCLLIATVVAAEATTDDEAPSLQITGGVQWTLSAGFGNVKGLSETYPKDRIKAEQRIRLRLTGNDVAGISLEVNLDNLQFDHLQHASVSLKRGDFTGRLGDFHFRPANPVVARPITLKGIELTGPLGPIRATAALARVQGTPAAKEFTGETGQDEIHFVPGGSYTPTRAGDRLQGDLSGLVHFALDVPFDRDFADLYIVWENEVSPGRTLWEVLHAHGLGQLIRDPDHDDDTPGGVLAPGDAVRVTPEAYASPWGADVVLLRRLPGEIVRGQLQELIRLYNTQTNLQSEDRLRYPYLAGTAGDEALLSQLVQSHTMLGVGSDPLSVTLIEKFGNGSRDRFFDLGQPWVEFGSEIIRFRRGAEVLEPGDLAGLLPVVYYDDGVLDLGPDAASQLVDVDMMEVVYRYRIDGAVYLLGHGVIVGSERVYLNDQRLSPDVVYSLDYESGIMTMVVPVTVDDRIRVEYETFRGGLGGSAEYPRSFYGGQAEFELRPGWNVALDVVRGQDGQMSGIDTELLQTMPNTHTVSGVYSRYQRGPWNVEARLAHSHDRFPFDDNLRDANPNRIRTLLVYDAPAGPVVLAGDQNKLSTWAGDGTPIADQRHAYGPSQGLAGAPVYDVAIDPSGLWFFATDGGLTVARVGVTPTIPADLDRATTWRRQYVSHGLPSNKTQSVLVSEERVWVGTDRGLAVAHVERFWNDQVVWSTLAVVGSRSVRSLVSFEGLIYVATDDGLVVLDVTGGFIAEYGRGQAFHAVAASPAGSAGGGVYAVSHSGVYRLDGGALVHVFQNPSVRAVAFWDQRLWIGTADGLWALDSGHDDLLAEPIALAGTTVTALAVESDLDGLGEALWIGMEADGPDAAALAVLDSIGGIETFSFDETGIEPTDSDRYRDVTDVDARTAVGWHGHVEVRRRFERGSLRFGVEQRDLGFLPLGGLQREQLSAWNVGGDLALTSNLTLTLDRWVDERDRMSVPDEIKKSTETMQRDRMALSWKGGLETDLSYETTLRSERGVAKNQEDRYALAAGLGLLAGRLKLRSGLEQIVFQDWLDGAKDSTMQVFSGEADLRLGAGFTFGLKVRQPIQQSVGGTPEARGSATERMEYRLNWQGDTGFFRYRLGFTDVKRGVEAQTGRTVHTRQTNVRIETPVLQVAGLNLRPVLVASRRGLYTWHTSHERTEVGGTLQLVWSALQLYGSVTKGVTDYIGTDRREDTEHMRFTAHWVGWPHVTPEVSWSRNRRVVQSPSLGQAVTGGGLASVGVTWRLHGRTTVTARVRQSEQVRRHSHTQEKIGEIRLTYLLSPLTSMNVRLENGSKHQLMAASEELFTKVELSGEHDFSERWSAEAVGGVVWGTNNGDPYASTYGRLSAQLQF